MASLIEKVKAKAAEAAPESHDVIMEVGETKLTATHLTTPDGKVSLLEVDDVSAKTTCCGLKSQCEVKHSNAAVETNPLVIKGPNALELNEKMNELKGAAGIP